MQIKLHRPGGVATLMLNSFAVAHSNFPAKPVTMVLPFAAGGPVDVEARRHAARLTELLEQSSPGNNIRELIPCARVNPGKVNWSDK